VTLLLLAVSVSASGGIYTDDLSRCLVESTTEADRVNLVKWMFTAASAHPAVQPLAVVSSEDVESANREMAELIVRLLADACREEAQKATKYEGASTFEASFGILGQVAGKELFASPEVGAALSGLEAYLDEGALEFLRPGE
jgi:hypothetical protein